MGKKSGDKGALLILWLIYIFIVIFLAYMTKAGIDKIFIGTSPLLLYIIVFVALSFHKHIKGFHVWLAPLIFPLVFFAFWYSELFSSLNALDGLQLTIFNIAVAYIINIVFLLAYVEPKTTHTGHHHAHHRTQHQVHHRQKAHHTGAVSHTHRGAAQHTTRQQPHARQQNPHHHASQLHRYHRQNQQYAHEINKLRRQVHELQKRPQITQENFKLNLKSIEDKCKAINFVIGRVYSDKKGGSPELREKINIPREMYNAFSEMAAEFKQEHMGHLRQILDQINQKLLQMELPENQVVQVAKNPHISIDRNPNGTDKIIAVLSRNDQDPVGEYHSEAKEICKSLTEFIRQNYR